MASRAKAPTSSTSSAGSSRSTAARTPKSASSTARKPAARGDGKKKVARHVDQRVAQRNTALNAFGGVKVDVFVRIRPQDPLREKEEDVAVVADPEEQQITLTDPAGHPATYTYDKVYGPDIDQEQVYNDAVAPIVEQVCSGLSCCIFAYGQTGAGKTYTMRGDLSGDPSKHGIIQRSLVHLFNRLNEHDYSNVEVKSSFLEIYNEELEDLFTDSPPPKDLKKSKRGPPTSSGSAQRLTLVDHDSRGCVCDGLVEVPVEGLEQVMNLLEKAEERCKYSETKMNKWSNRAHRIFTLVVSFLRYDKPVTATLTFVDLAGSEDISKSGATGMTAREAAHINRSLLTLGRVINALACNEKHIPYRDSKLTRLLSEALGGVCKTSFIACVSPCSGSTVESNSTLRYAERAMEALNISQLPRWKQDEIIIDGLTRRVQQLVDDLESMRKMHHEEMRDLRNERDHLLEENEEHKREIARQRRKINRLLTRKSELKSSTSLLTSQKQNLLAEKEALQKELLETRQQRDGYLADRKMLMEVIGGVRQMREKLLVAHRSTEKSLTTDALALKQVIEGAIVDIDDLHAEVSRKKELSLFNEQIADDFRDRLSEKLRSIVQEVNDFKSDQDQEYNTLRGLLSDMKDARQKETSSLTQDLSKLTTTITGVFDDVHQRAQETHASRAARITRGRDDAAAHLQQLKTVVDKAQEVILRRCQEAQEQAAELDTNLATWAGKVRTHLDDVDNTTKNFTSELSNHLQTLGTHVQTATAAQLQQLQQHSDELASFLASEKSTMEETCNRLVEDIGSYVKRMVADVRSQNARRLDTGFSGFQNSASALSQQVQDLQDHGRGEMAALAAKATAHLDANTTLCGVSKDTNNSMWQSSKKLLQGETAMLQQTEQDMRQHAGTINDLAGQHHAGKLQYFQDDQDFAKASLDATEQITRAGTQSLQSGTEALRKNVVKYGKSFAEAGKTLDDGMVGSHDMVRTFVTATDEGLFDAEADGVNYVMQEIKRDVKEPPARREYTYPKEYDATDPYETILVEQPTEWKREVDVREGQRSPGLGTDFVGQPGPEDDSGILTTTRNKPPTSDEAHLLQRAVYESDAAEYDDPPGYEEPDSDEEEDNEDTVEGQAQEQEPADELGQEESQSQPDTDMPEQNGEALEVASEPAEDEAEEDV